MASNPIRDVQQKNRPQLNVQTPTSRLPRLKPEDSPINELSTPQVPEPLPPVEPQSLSEVVAPAQEEGSEDLVGEGDVSLEALQGNVVTPYAREVDDSNSLVFPGSVGELDATTNEAFSNAPTIGEANAEAAANLRSRQDNVTNIVEEDGAVVQEWEEYGLYDGKPATVGENENRRFYDRIYRTVEGLDKLMAPPVQAQGGGGPLPQTRTDERQFRPDSTGNPFAPVRGEWKPFGGVFAPNSANGRGLTFNEFGLLLRGFGFGALDRKATNLFSYGEYGSGSLGRLLYAISLPGNIVKGASTDVEVATQKARKTGKSQRIGYTHLRRAFTGNNYDFAQPSRPDRPLGLMDFGVKWYKQPLKFAGGLILDVLTDPTDLLVGAVGLAGKGPKAAKTVQEALPSTRALPPSAPVAGTLPPYRSGAIVPYAVQVNPRPIPKVQLPQLSGVPEVRIPSPKELPYNIVTPPPKQRALPPVEQTLVTPPGPKYRTRTTIIPDTGAQKANDILKSARQKGNNILPPAADKATAVKQAELQAAEFLKEVRRKAIERTRNFSVPYIAPLRKLPPGRVKGLLPEGGVKVSGKQFLVVDTDAVVTPTASKVIPETGKRVTAFVVEQTPGAKAPGAAVVDVVQDLVASGKLIPTEGMGLVDTAQQVVSDVAQMRRLDAAILRIQSLKRPTKKHAAKLSTLQRQRDAVVQRIEALAPDVLAQPQTIGVPAEAVVEQVIKPNVTSIGGQTSVPVVKQEDLVGTPSTTEVMQQLDELEAGAQVNTNTVTEVRRTNKDLTELAVELGHIKPRKKALSRVQLDQLQEKHGDLYRAEGRPVRETIEKLRSTATPLVELTAKGSDGTPAELVPVRLQRVTQEVQEAPSTSVGVLDNVQTATAPSRAVEEGLESTEQILRKRAELEGQLDAAKTTDEFDRIAQQIDELDEMLVGPPDIHSSSAIARYQSENLPRELRSESPVGLAKTRELMAAEQLVDEAAFAEQRLFAELENQELFLERALNDIEQFPDTGRLPLSDNPSVPVPRVGGALSVPGNINQDLVERLMETPFFHGTKVQALDFKSADPLRGGSRGEFGPAHYFTNQPDVAENFAKATPNSNLPPVEGRTIAEQGEVLEVSLGVERPLDATLPGDETIRQVFIEEAKKTNIAEDIIERYARELERGHTPKAKKPPRPLREYWNLLGEIRQEEMGRLLNDMNQDFPERTILEFQRRVNARLIEMGYDSIVMYDNVGQMVVGVLQPGAAYTVNRTMVEGGTDLLEMATARLNATSHIAELNPQAVTSRVDYKEATVALMSRMVENTKKLLEESEALAGRYADHAHRTKKKLEKIVREEQTQRRVTETTQAILEDADQSRKLNEPPNPCEF